jgi:hypothetical protein
MFSLFVFLLSAQNDSLQFDFVSKKKMTIDRFIGVDNFDNLYTLKNNVITKNGAYKNYEYINIQLGDVHHVDITNPLKIVVFYKDQNSVIMLDNTLSEILVVNFNQTAVFRKVVHVSAAFDNSIWIYNELNQQLERYNYIEDKTVVNTLPFSSSILLQGSNYNYCWIITATTIECYNPYGSNVNTFKNDAFEKMHLYRNNVLLVKQNQLFYLNTKNNINKVKTPIEITLQDFSITNESLYIYDSEFLYQFKLIP